MDIATEELAHVEMLAVMIARLLEGAPIAVRDAAVEQYPAVAAVMGGMDPQHAIVSGLGATFNDSQGVPWNSRYTIASGNLLADFRFNVTVESLSYVGEPKPLTPGTARRPARLRVPMAPPPPTAR